MKRRNLTPEENAKNISFNPSLGIKHQVLRDVSVTDDFHMERIPRSDGSEMVVFTDPIRILFNQKRLETMGVTAAKTFLDSLAPKSNSLDELRKQCSDDDLMYMIKSRHLQSPAEILSWCRYMNENVETFNSEVAKLLAKKEAEQAEQNKSTEPVSVVETKPQ